MILSVFMRLTESVSRSVANVSAICAKTGASASDVRNSIRTIAMGYGMDKCNVASCRFWQGRKCQEQERRKECLQVAMDVLSVSKQQMDEIVENIDISRI